MLKVVIRLVVDAAIVGTALFASAGTLEWARAWVLLAVLLVVRLISAVAVYRVNPALIRERAGAPLHDGQPASDKLLVLAVLGTGFVGLSILAGLDVFHLHLLPAPNRFVTGAGLVLFVCGWTAKGMALRANAFATSTVRVQRERAHSVVDSGIYSKVRHPFYAGTLCVLIGQSLWLTSYAAAIGSIVPIALVIVRLMKEERFLQQALPAYQHYSARVRFRIVPGIW